MVQEFGLFWILDPWRRNRQVVLKWR